MWLILALPELMAIVFALAVLMWAVSEYSVRKGKR